MSCPKPSLRLIGLDSFYGFMALSAKEVLPEGLAHWINTSVGPNRRLF